MTKPHRTKNIDKKSNRCTMDRTDNKYGYSNVNDVETNGYDVVNS